MNNFAKGIPIAERSQKIALRSKTQGGFATTSSRTPKGCQIGDLRNIPWLASDCSALTIRHPSGERGLGCDLSLGPSIQGYFL